MVLPLTSGPSERLLSPFQYYPSYSLCLQTHTHTFYTPATCWRVSFHVVSGHLAVLGGLNWDKEQPSS